MILLLYKCEDLVKDFSFPPCVCFTVLSSGNTNYTFHSVYRRVLFYEFTAHRDKVSSGKELNAYILCRFQLCYTLQVPIRKLINEVLNTFLETHKFVLIKRAFCQLTMKAKPWWHSVRMLGCPLEAGYEARNTGLPAKEEI